MYNRAPYNRIRYNHPFILNHALETTVRIAEASEGFAGSGLAFSTSALIVEALASRGRIYRLLPIAGAMAETSVGNAKAGYAYIATADLHEVLCGDAHSSAVFWPELELIEALTGKAPAAAAFFVDARLPEAKAGTAPSGFAYVLVESVLYEHLIGRASGYNYEENIFEFTGELPPGSTLIIDSDPDILDVFLNNASALHRKTGKWLYLDRKTMEYTIEHTAGEEVEYEVTYYNLYL